MDDRRILCYRELYQTGLLYAQLAARIKALSTAEEEIQYVAADPSVVEKKTEAGNTFTQEFRQYGLSVVAAKNNRLEGWNNVHAFLQQRQDPNSGQTFALLQITSNCHNLIRTLPEQIHDEKDVEDLDTKGEDHCLAGSTLVDTTDGQIPIRDLIGTRGLICSRDKLIRTYHSVRRTRLKAKVLRMTLKDGRSIVLTPDHRVLTQRGWVQARKIAVGFDGLIQCDTWNRLFSRRRSKNSKASAITSADNTFSMMEKDCILPFWEYHHGKVPRGHHIHHADHNRANNSPTNLQCHTAVQTPIAPCEHARSAYSIGSEHCGIRCSGGEGVAPFAERQTMARSSCPRGLDHTKILCSSLPTVRKSV